jgi:glycolate oxidase
MNRDDLYQKLAEALGPEAVIADPEKLQAYSGDMTENDPAQPVLAVCPGSAGEVQAVVRLCAQQRVPITPVVANTNLGGLAIPARGGLVMDLRRMNRALEVDRDDLFAVIEPGVTWQQLHDHLEQHAPELRFAYPLSPPESGIVPNCLLDGLANLSLRAGPASYWINALEAVLPDGRLLRTGHWAYGGKPCARAPFPQIEGLFVNFAGTTGVVTRLAVQLWPAPAHRRRFFLMAYDAAEACAALRHLAREDLADDLGALSWASGKMLFGDHRPLWRDPAEPLLFLYLDVSGHHRELFEARVRVIERRVRQWRKAGTKLDGPLDIADLVRLEPRFGKFADFPTRLDFLLDGHGGGLSWVGTYGPTSRFAEGFSLGSEILVAHGFSPVVVCRPMLGGHFGVLRWISVFDRADPAEVARVKAANRELAEMSISLGFFPYKTPQWVWDAHGARLDPVFRDLVDAARRLLDPAGIMNPGRLRLPPLSPP